MDGNEDSEPPDIGSSSQDIFLDSIEISKIEPHKKRKHSDSLGSEPKVKSNMASPPNCAISTVFIHPDADSKKQYSTDPGPYIVHVSYISTTPYSGATLRPIKFGQFLLQNKIKNISKDGLKKLAVTEFLFNLHHRKTPIFFCQTLYYVLIITRLLFQPIL